MSSNPNPTSSTTPDTATAERFTAEARAVELSEELQVAVDLEDWAGVASIASHLNLVASTLTGPSRH